MPIIRGGSQATLADLTNGVAPSIGPRTRAAGPTPESDATPTERIGVVFVHGIGSQLPADTLLDWSRPVIKILTEWRRRHGHPPDPVVASRIDFSGSQAAVIQLDVPRMPPDDDDPNDYPAQTWFMSEAWWASNVRPPSLGTMARWLVADMGRVVSAVQEAANERRRGGEPGTTGLSWWVHAVDELQSVAVAGIVGVLWTIGAALGIPYSIVRSLPLVGDRFAIAQLDSFLVDWFGDLRVLLHDQAQAANIRGRLAETLSTLRDDYDCTSILVVAHSGGVIVSLTTLSDPFFAEASGRGAFPVTKLLTIGQGMGLAWNLWNAWKVHLPFGDRLMASPYDQYPRLRWIDFWGTYDPAPAGKFKAPRPEEAAAVAAAQGSAAAAAVAALAPAPPTLPRDASAAEAAAGKALGPLESRPVWNRMSFREDHGGYWDNEEQFVIDLIREIDTAGDPAGRPDTSRFFRGAADQATRVSRRIERVAILGWWRWLAAIGTTLALLFAWLQPSSGHGDRLADIGAFAAQEFAKLPGHEVGSGPLDSVANIANQIGEVPAIGPALAFLGQAAVVLAVVMVLAAVPGWFGWWHRLVARFDRNGRMAQWRTWIPWPSWLPYRIAVAIGIYVIGGVVVAIGSASSVGWIVNGRSWMADRVHDLWTAQTGNVLVGAIVVVLVFVAIEVWGASRWQGWDERERYEARSRPLPPVDRRRIKIQAALFVLLLIVAVVVIGIAEVP